MEQLKFKTIDECVDVAEKVWNQHVQSFRARARDEMRQALNAGREGRAEHWRLMAHVLDLDPRDWDGFGLLNRWDGEYEGEPGDCSAGCTYFRPLAGDLGTDWGTCTNPSSHRKGKLTFEHQGCPAFESEVHDDLDFEELNR